MFLINQPSKRVVVCSMGEQVPSTGRAYCKFQMLHGEDWQKLGGAQVTFDCSARACCLLLRKLGG